MIEALREQLDFRGRLIEFARWHRDPRNVACHFFGIPGVTLPVLGALARIQIGTTEYPFIGRLDVALLLLAGTLLFDLVLAPALAPGVFGLGLVLWWIARPLPPWTLGLVFAIGWTFQLVGHRVLEKNAPAFTDNLVHLVVGPRWLVNRIFRVFPET